MPQGIAKLLSAPSTTYQKREKIVNSSLHIKSGNIVTAFFVLALFFVKREAFMPVVLDAPYPS